MARARTQRSEETADLFLKRVLFAFEERERRADAETRAFVPTPSEARWITLADAIDKMVSARDVPLHLAFELDSPDVGWEWSQLGDHAICLITGIQLNHSLPAWTELRVLAVADAIAASVFIEVPHLTEVAVRLRESTFAPEGRTFDGVKITLNEAMQYLRMPGHRLEIALAYDAMYHAAQRIAQPFTPLTKLFMSAREAGIPVGEILRAMGPPTLGEVIARAGRE